MSPSSVGLLFGSLVVQLLPALVAAVWWRRAQRRGVIAGILFGVAIWLFFIGAPLLMHRAVTNWLPFAVAAAPTRLMGSSRALPPGNAYPTMLVLLWVPSHIASV